MNSMLQANGVESHSFLRVQRQGLRGGGRLVNL